MIRRWLILICLFIPVQNCTLYAGDNGDNDKEKYVVSFLFAFPEKPIRDLPLSAPQALAIDQEGHVFVVDTGNSRLLKFDKQGNFVNAIGSFGWEREQFDRPTDITAKTGLDLFVADFNNERIERYDLKLNYLSTFRSEETVQNSLRFGFPSGVDISRHGELFICDNENDRILKLNTTGSPDLSFGDFNWGDGQLEHPVRVEVSRKDQVYVSDQGLNQIFVFDYYGNYISRFGQEILNNPTGLNWSIDNRLYVADSGNQRVVAFNARHLPIHMWGQEGDKFGAFSNPVDVATFDNQVYVLDSSNNRIQVFKLGKRENHK
ncbi:6-bladed beta-propeller [candidate division KSB1 bacterium]|nr:6-bladed beta-propeller [candidate division KSB1 bacterium]NIR68467.1 6-bladed beta-propeller [candidate division KSB1 bacterium]NIS25118.1 6-bladed beta-propeller [candidate division KSB1 bacterium]NIT72030.1 6-bladed beta-propeller [candidate division KSB1 bacterium]NIU25817.1 6-bladed beta-propeller [candidate division KSB1 bacterium]